VDTIVCKRTLIILQDFNNVVPLHSLKVNEKSITKSSKLNGFYSKKTKSLFILCTETFAFTSGVFLVRGPGNLFLDLLIFLHCMYDLSLYELKLCIVSHMYLCIVQ
jgi:hypothetical protein